jgi:hypothetical protein
MSRIIELCEDTLKIALQLNAESARREDGE